MTHHESVTKYQQSHETQRDTMRHNETPWALAVQDDALRGIVRRSWRQLDTVETFRTQVLRDPCSDHCTQRTQSQRYNTGAVFYHKLKLKRWSQ